MKNIKAVLLAVALAPWWLGGCTQPSDAETAMAAVEEGEGHGHEEEGTPDVVRITARQAEAIGLETGAIEYKPLQHSIAVTGTLELFPQNRANVGALMPGRVDDIRVVEGDRIGKGGLLATLTNPEFIDWQQQLLERLSRREYLLQEKERKEKLFEKQITSGREYQLALAEWKANEAAINSLRSKLQLLGIDPDKVAEGRIFSRIPVRAPISGYVHKVMVSMGDYVEPQDDLFDLANNRRVHVDLRVFEKDIFKVRKGQKVVFTVANHPDKVFEATIHTIGRAFEDDLKSIHVHAEMDNADDLLLPGMYVEGRILQETEPRPVLPEEAVVREADLAWIFVQLDEASMEDADDHHEEEADMLRFRRVPVVAGEAVLGYVPVQLLEPLPDDARVVIRGAYMLSSELIKGELEHEH